VCVSLCLSSVQKVLFFSDLAISAIVFLPCGLWDAESNAAPGLIVGQQWTSSAEWRAVTMFLGRKLTDWVEKPHGGEVFWLGSSLTLEHQVFFTFGCFCALLSRYSISIWDAFWFENSWTPEMKQVAGEWIFLRKKFSEIRFGLEISLHECTQVVGWCLLFDSRESN
jgi:hypothetical protein